MMLCLRGERCARTTRCRVATWEQSIPTAQSDTTHSYTYWRACSSGGISYLERDKCSNGVHEGRARSAKAWPVSVEKKAGEAVGARGASGGGP